MSSNKVKYNLKNVHAAKLTETVGTDGTSTYKYDTPKAILGAVNISLDAEGESSPFYADDVVYFRAVTNNGYSGNLEIALIPEWFRTEILQEELDNSGVLFEKSTITADPRSDGIVKARTGDTTDASAYEAWYKSVYTANTTTKTSGKT